MTFDVPTQPVPVHIRQALDALMAISADDPELDLAFRAIEAVATLRTVRPIYPPPIPVTAWIPAERAVELASAALDRAIANASSAEEAIRAGAAAAALAGRPVDGFL